MIFPVAGSLPNWGFPAVGAMVEEHVILKDFQSGGNLLDKEIVFYADKRVMHDRIVTVEERVADLIIRYGTTEERIRLINSNGKQICQLEVKISRFMTSDLQEILDGIDPESSSRSLAANLVKLRFRKHCALQKPVSRTILQVIGNAGKLSVS